MENNKPKYNTQRFYFKRICDACNTMFKPTARNQKLCQKCNKKRIERTRKYLGLKKTRKKIGKGIRFNRQLKGANLLE